MFYFLQFYSKNKDSIATTLLKPKQKQGAKSAELELSKSKFETYVTCVFTPSLSLVQVWKTLLEDDDVNR